MGITEILFLDAGHRLAVQRPDGGDQQEPVLQRYLADRYFFTISGHYILLNAQFLAVVNIIVYAGAIMVLFLFVIMLMNLIRIPSRRRTNGFARWRCSRRLPAAGAGGGPPYTEAIADRARNRQHRP
jgi:hypothetical protein